MSATTVDNRVVEMRFDNAQFEAGVKTSMSTLEKLKKSLKLDGASKGLEDVSSAAKKVDMSRLSSSVETVKTQFSALQVIGVTTLANITNSAINTGKQMISAFTLDPVKMGFKEYETQINAVQTILANTKSKGTTLDQVNEALDTLNAYADKTIYNFTEMTRNIGTFTAAGIDLDTSVNAIQGIANLAAISGSSSQQASTAMYQLSQALASGTVKLMDWNSVVNAGMGGQVFQDALKETARVHGIAIDSMIDEQGSFRETLQKGWLTSEILTETLQKFTLTTEGLTDAQIAQNREMLKSKGYTEAQIDAIFELGKTSTDAATKVKTFTQLMDTLKEAAQSGWTQSWKIMIGDFEESKELFTELSEVFGGIIQKSADARNKMLEGAMSSKWSQLSKQVEEAGVSVSDFQKALIEAGKEHGVVTDEMIQEAGSFEKSLKRGWLTSDIVIETLKKLSGAQSEVSNSTEDMSNKLEYFQKVVDDVWRGEYKNGEERMVALSEAGYEYAKVQELVNKTVDGHRLTLEDLSDTQLQSIGYTNEEISKLRELADQAEKTGTPLNELIQNLSKPSGRELLIDTFRNALTAITRPIGAIRDAWSEIFSPKSSNRLYGFIEGMHSLSKVLVMSEDSADKLKRTFKGVFAILDLVTTITGGFAKIGFTVITELLKALGLLDGGILTVTANIGDAIVAFRDWFDSHSLINKSIKALVPLLIKIGTAIGGLFKKVSELPVVQNSISKIGDAIYKVSEKFKSAIENATEFIGGLQNTSFEDISINIIDGFVNGLKDGAVKVVKSIMDIGTKMLNVIKNVLGIHSPSREFFAIGLYSMEGMVNGIKSGISLVFDVLKAIGSKMLEFFSDLDLGTVIAGVLSVGLLVTMKKMTDVIIGFTTPLAGLGNIFNSVAGQIRNPSGAIKKVLDSLSKTMKSFSFKMRAEGIKTIAESIAILVGALAVLSMLDYDKLQKSMLILLEISAIFVVLIGVVEGLSILSAKVGAKPLDFGKISMGLMGISTAVLIIAKAVKTIGSLNPTQVEQSLYGLVAIIGGMSILLMECAGLSIVSSEKNIAKIGTLMIKMSVSMLLMSLVMKSLGKLKIDAILAGTTAIIAFVGVFTAMGFITKATGFNADKLGKTLVKMSISMMLLIGVMKLVSTLDILEIAKGTAAIFGFIAVLGALTLITNLGRGSDKLGKTLTGMAASMLVMTLVVKMLSKMNPADIAKGVAGMTAFAGVIAMMIMVSKLAGNDLPKIAGTITAMSVAIGVMAGVAILLSLISLEGLAKGVVAVGLLGTVISGMILATKGAYNVKGNLVAMSVAIGVMAAAVAALSFVNPKKLATASAALSSIMGMFAFMTKCSQGGKSSMKSLIVMTGVVVVLAGVLKVLGDLKVGSSIESAASISLLLLTMATSLSILDSVKSVSNRALGALAAIELAVVGIAVILGVLTTVCGDTQPSVETATALSILLIAMSEVCVILGTVGKLAGGAIVGALALDAVIVIVGGLMLGIGALFAHFTDLESNLDKGITILQKVGNGIGSFFGGIINGFSVAATDGLPKIADNIARFMKTFSEIDSNTIDGVKSLTECVVLISAGSIMDGISRFLNFGSSSFDTFAVNLVKFGKAIVGFSGIVSGKIDAEAITAAGNAGKALSEMQKNVQGIGGLAQAFTGIKDLGAFGEQLKAFGSAICEFSATITEKGINPEAVEIAKNAGLMMAELQDSIEPVYGVAQAFTGMKDLGVFGEQLKAFGTAVCEFSATITEKGINSGAVETAKNAGLMMAELQDAIEPVYGVAQAFTGMKDLGFFGNQMKAFGTAVCAFSETVSAEGAVNSDAVETAKHVGIMMAELQKSVEPILGFSQIFTGTKTLTAFGNQLQAFGSALTGYSKIVSEANWTTVTTSIDHANKLLDLSDRAVQNDTTWTSNFASYTSSIIGALVIYTEKAKSIVNDTTIEDSIGSATELQTFIENLSGMDTSGVTSFVTALERLNTLTIDEFAKTFGASADAFVMIGSDIMRSIEKGMTFDGSIITIALNNIISAALEALESTDESFKESGALLASMLISGINSKTSDVTTTMESVLKSSISSIDSYYDDFYDSGAYVAKGLADGIISSIESVRKAAVEMAAAAEPVVRAKLQIHSPSRVFERLGKFVPEGFAKGIGMMAYVVKASVNGMTSGALKETRNSLSKISTIINGDIDTRPTIRPVLDLSDVSSGIGSLNGMLDLRPSIGMMANIRDITSMMNQNHQNGGNSDVVSAINKLRKDLGNVNSATYNINGVTYDDGSNITNAVESIVRAARVERRM